MAAMRELVEDGIDTMKVSNDDIDAMLVGGGCIILPTDLAGTATCVKPEHSGCANAIGSAISKVSGTYEALVDYDEHAARRRRSSRRARRRRSRLPSRRALCARPSRSSTRRTCRLQYYPGHTNRVKVKAAGDLSAAL